MIKCKFCGHSANRHVDDGGMCKSTGCFCVAQKRIIEKVEGYQNEGEVSHNSESGDRE